MLKPHCSNRAKLHDVEKAISIFRSAERQEGRHLRSRAIDVDPNEAHPKGEAFPCELRSVFQVSVKDMKILQTDLKKQECRRMIEPFHAYEEVQQGSGNDPNLYRTRSPTVVKTTTAHTVYSSSGDRALPSQDHCCRVCIRCISIDAVFTCGSLTFVLLRCPSTVVLLRSGEAD